MGAWEEIAGAIAGKRVIELDYGGRTRIGEPHALADMGGRRMLRFYQIDGESESGIMGWKLLYLDRVASVRATEHRFPGRRPTDSGSDYRGCAAVVDW